MYKNNSLVINLSISNKVLKFRLLDKNSRETYHSIPLIEMSNVFSQRTTCLKSDLCSNV